jgi:hypothetical protein
MAEASPTPGSSAAKISGSRFVVLKGRRLLLAGFLHAPALVSGTLAGT